MFCYIITYVLHMYSMSSVSVCSGQSARDKKQRLDSFLFPCPPLNPAALQPCRDPEGCGVQNTLHRQQLHHQCQHVSRCDPSACCCHTAAAKFPSHDVLVHSFTLDHLSHEGLEDTRVFICPFLEEQSLARTHLLSAIYLNI